MIGFRTLWEVPRQHPIEGSAPQVVPGHAAAGIVQHRGDDHGAGQKITEAASADDRIGLQRETLPGFPPCGHRCQYGPWLASPFCGVDRGVLLWSSVCHHVKREASRFIPSILLRATIYRLQLDLMGLSAPKQIEPAEAGSIARRKARGCYGVGRS